MNLHPASLAILAGYVKFECQIRLWKVWGLKRDANTRPGPGAHQYYLIWIYGPGARNHLPATVTRSSHQGFKTSMRDCARIKALYSTALRPNFRRLWFRTLCNQRATRSIQLKNSETGRVKQFTLVSRQRYFDENIWLCSIIIHALVIYIDPYDPGLASSNSLPIYSS